MNSKIDRNRGTRPIKEGLMRALKTGGDVHASAVSEGISGAVQGALQSAGEFGLDAGHADAEEIGGEIVDEVRRVAAEAVNEIKSSRKQ